MYRDINLIPEERLRKKPSTGFLPLKPIVIVALLIAVGLLFYLPHYLVSSIKHRGAGIEYEIVQKNYIQDLKGTAEALQSRIDERQDIITKIQSERTQWSAVIKGVASRAPDGIFLSVIDCSTSDGMTITGYSDSYGKISLLISGIQRVEGVGDVLPVRLAKQSQQQYVFVIRCTMEGRGNGTEGQ
jgi:Tfp pilus assembly protein PilN